jgi:hypothetical protein
VALPSCVGAAEDTPAIIWAGASAVIMAEDHTLECLDLGVKLSVSHRTRLQCLDIGRHCIEAGDMLIVGVEIVGALVEQVDETITEESTECAVRPFVRLTFAQRRMG